MFVLKNSRWEKVTTQQLLGFGIGISLFALLVLKSRQGWVFCIDPANAMFHEAGHPLVGLFSERLKVYGGTMGQLTFPVVLAVSFWRRREAIGFAVGIIWFFENWLNIARYMADARAQILPLIGGDIHDWGEIFRRWHVLKYDTQIAGFVRCTGWIGMSVACVWVLWLGITWRAPKDEGARPEVLGAV